MPEQDREPWVERTAESLAAHLVDYSPAECRELAELLYRVADHPVDGTMDRAEQILYMLLRQQGLDEASAIVVTHAAGHIDWSRLFIGSRAVGALLDANAPDLLKYRQAGTLVPAIEHRTGTRLETVAYSLAEILTAVAMDRIVPRGAGKRRFRWRS